MAQRNKIMEISNYQRLQKGSVFQKGVQDFKDGKCGEHGNKRPIWVKKLVIQREWNSYYQYCQGIYSDLGSVGGIQQEDGSFKGGKKKIGFCAVGGIPKDCELLTDEEVIQLNECRKGVNISPLPLVDIIPKQRIRAQAKPLF